MVVKCLLLLQALTICQSMCPNWCSQRGICTSPAQGGYCDCNMGYTGDDCGKTICPYAFEPLALEKATARRTFRLKTEVERGTMAGRIEFTFAGSTVVFDADAGQMDSAACVSTMSQLKSIQSLTCERESFQEASGTGAYLITLESYPEKAHFNNLIQHTGNPPLSLFYCNTTLVDHEEASAPRCFLEDITVRGDLPQYVQCGGHGECDTYTGVCECVSGFNGPACDDTRDSYDKVVHEHDGPFFRYDALWRAVVVCVVCCGVI